MIDNQAPHAAVRTVVVHLGSVAMMRPQYVDLLDVDEQARYFSYRAPERRASFGLGAVAIRLIGGRSAGVHPRRVTVNRRCRWCGEPHGKPAIGEADSPFVSLSRSGGAIVIASSTAALGVDIEHVRRQDHSRLAQRICSDEPTPATPEDLTTVWCRKEAVVKATGDGIGVGLHRVRVTPADQPPRLLSYPRQVCFAVADLPLRAELTGAVAVRHTDRIQVTIRSLSDLLSDVDRVTAVDPCVTWAR